MPFSVIGCVVIDDNRNIQNINNYNLLGCNFFAGSCAGLSNTGTNNIFLGSCAGRCNTSGSNNFFAGLCAGFSNTTANDNIFLGREAGKSNTTGCQNIFIGSFAGTSNTTGNFNFFAGFCAGFSNTTGTNNTFIGFEAGRNNTTGCQNTFLGHLAGCANTTGCFNTFLGFNAGRSNTTGNFNTFMGLCAGSSNTTGCLNTFLGYQAGCANTTGLRNTFIGFEAGRNNTAGSCNTFIGYYAGCSNTTGQYNTFLGHYTGRANTTGGINTFIGAFAGRNNTAGSCNTFIGLVAGFCNTVGGCNTFIGLCAGRSNTTGNFNTFLSFCAGFCNTTGCQNTFLGFNAGRSNTTGNFNTFLGFCAGFCNTTGNQNTFLGYFAGACNTTGSCNTFLGFCAGRLNTTGCFNTFLGYFAGACNTTGTNNTFLGREAGTNVTTGVCNTIIGQVAGTSSLSNTIILAAGSCERMRIDSSGNLGLGVTPSAWVSNAKAIQVGVFLAAWTGSNGSSNLGFGAYEGGVNTYNYLTTGDAPTFYSQLTGAHRWYTAPSGTAGNAISFTQAMTLDASGNLGIGVAPTYKLDVFGGTLGTSTGNQIIVERLNTTTGNADFLEISKLRTSAGSDWTTAAWRLQQKVDNTWMGWMQFNGTGNTAGLAFGTGLSTGAPSDITERMRLDSSGNLGLGVTPSAWSGTGGNIDTPNGKNLTSQGTNLGIGTNSYFNVTWIYAGTGLASRYVQDAGQHQWFTAPSGTAGNAISFTQAMTLDASGNLGIGSTGGDYGRTWRFVASRNHNGRSDFGFLNNTVGANASVVVSKIGGTGNSFIDWSLVDNNGSPYDQFEYGSGVNFVRWNFGGSERMRITSGGSVGIGTTNPVTKLEVYGGHGDTTFRLYSTGDGSTLDASLDLWASEPGITFDGTGIGHNVNGHPFYGRRNSNMGQSYIRFINGNIFFTSTSTATLDVHAALINNGNFGIGTTSPGAKLEVSGTTRVTSLGVGTAASGTTGEIRATNEITAYYSDRRLKENIHIITDPITKIKQLSGITYNPNDIAEKYGYNKSSKLVGLFADEVELVLPEAVRPAPFDIDEDGNSISGDNYKTIQYERLIPLLIEAIKEQDRKIEKLEIELRSLKQNN